MKTAQTFILQIIHIKSPKETTYQHKNPKQKYLYSHRIRPPCDFIRS